MQSCTLPGVKSAIFSGILFVFCHLRAVICRGL